MLGILGGAMAGVGGAMQENARGTLEEQRQMRLEEMRNRYQTQRDEAQHGRTLERDEIQHGRTLERDDLQHGRMLERDELSHGRSFELERYRQGQQNHRTGMQQRSQDARNMVQGQDEEGNPVWFNPVTGEQVAGPEGFRTPDQGPDARGDDWSRQRYEIQWLQDEIKRLEESLDMGGLSGVARQEAMDDLDQLRAELGRLRNHSIGRTSAGPRGEQAAEPSGNLTIDDFLGR